jgi:hypothetical protein
VDPGRFHFFDPQTGNSLVSGPADPEVVLTTATAGAA